MLSLAFIPPIAPLDMACAVFFACFLGFAMWSLAMPSFCVAEDDDIDDPPIVPAGGLEPMPSAKAGAAPAKTSIAAPATANSCSFIETSPGWTGTFRLSRYSEDSLRRLHAQVVCTRVVL